MSVSIKDFFISKEGEKQKGVAQRNNAIKRSIIAYMVVNGEATLSNLSKELHISIPTVTKLVEELMRDKIVRDCGKIETSGGRRPNTFDVADSAIYFAGVEVRRDRIYMVITDLKNQIIVSHQDVEFRLSDTDECLDTIVERVSAFLEESGIERQKVLGIGFCMVGRVNPMSGRSYKYFNNQEESLSEILERRLEHPVLIENDTRARCYGEYVKSCKGEAKDVIYLNLSRGVAIGVVVDGKLYYGKSGFAGEFGHTPFFNNEIICDCGKKGCLETEVSGIAIERDVIEQIKAGRNTILREKYDRGERIHITDVIKAVHSDDNLAIELIEAAGEKVGKSIAFLINIFNPEQVIVGGYLAQAGDYLMLPMKSAVNKYSLRLVYQDTQFRMTTLEDSIGAHGAAMLTRNKLIGL